MSFRIIYQDEHLVAIEKPAGFHVHPPEDSRHSISRSVNCLSLLRDQLGLYLYPVHRLDRATSGVLLFGLQKESARRLCQAFQNQEVRKVYVCVTRGWTNESGRIDYALSSESSENPPLIQESVTFYRQISQVELPHSVGRYSTARYSLVQVEPQSGRRHQIRRHFNHIAHPLVGDTVYGCGEHNRFFRDQLSVCGLLLKAYSIEMNHPTTGKPFRFVSRWNGLWHRVFDLFGVCPLII